MLVVSCAAALWMGCGGPTTPQTVLAFVQGRITASLGFAAEGATVVLEVSTLDGARVGAEPALTNATGRYATILAVFTDPFDGLMTVSASWSQGGTRQEATRTDIPIRFRRLADGIDSVSVDLVLQPVSAGSYLP